MNSKIRVLVAHVVENLKGVAVEALAEGKELASQYVVRDDKGGVLIRLDFQNGTVLEKGVTGVTNEALLAIVKDRLESFQAGEFPCQENQLALENINNALDYLKARSERRMKEGTEGTNTESSLESTTTTAGSGKNAPIEGEENVAERPAVGGNQDLPLRGAEGDQPVEEKPAEDVQA